MLKKRLIYSRIWWSDQLPFYSS